jgi:SAM-dependent methyltransferase
VRTYSDQRYLLSKKPADDRALNRPVLSALSKHLKDLELTGLGQGPLEVLELGAGVGTMVSRLSDWDVIGKARYTLVDRDAASLAAARDHIAKWGTIASSTSENDALAPLLIERGAAQINVVFEHRDAFDFIRASENLARFDLVVANAVLDLMDLEPALKTIWQGLKPNAPYWFSINFDGETIFLPETDLDALVMQLYHRTMDERVRDGEPCGDSKTGRHLLELLPKSGASLLAAGSSDWVVFPQGGAYPDDEAYFLHHIVNTIDVALTGRAELDRTAFAQWIERRHAQIDRGELIYIAHQIDVFGLTPSGG